MGSGNSANRSKRDSDEFNIAPEKMINGGSSISTIDTSHRRKLTDEEKNSKFKEEDYEDGNLGVTV